MITLVEIAVRNGSADGLFELNVDDAYAVPKLHLNRKHVDIKDVVSRFEYLRDIEHELPLAGGEMTVLIGIDNPSAHEVIQYRTDPDRPRSPHATLTPFGWCLVGPFAPYVETHTKNCFGITLANNPDRPSLSELMERLFDVDIFGIQPKEINTASPDEQRALRILDTTIRFTGERYEAGLLWKTDHPRLPDNRLTSLKRFYALERRLINDPYLAGKYVAVIEEYLSYDHAKVLTAEEGNVRPIGRTWYLPHHPVLNPNKPNKLRVVFDAAAKSRGTSLNSELLKGLIFLQTLLAYCYVSAATVMRVPPTSSKCFTKSEYDKKTFQRCVSSGGILELMKSLVNTK
ncbi:Gag Pol polyprotein [Trichuris trichiura]|uniref:Gag Pol polyprotein n=1 Tax=Trichuris trichiura TaxID=36087 RepID=A0A077ZNN6_TRITR|nr:Gag Pol polyprotein [Trichuris trichiura]